MYGATDMMMAAEVAYRREQLMAMRAPKKVRHPRREPAGWVQTLVHHRWRISAA